MAGYLILGCYTLTGVPLLIAWNRRVRGITALTFFTILTSWTVIGWFVALWLACTLPRRTLPALYVYDPTPVRRPPHVTIIQPRFAYGGMRADPADRWPTSAP